MRNLAIHTTLCGFFLLLLTGQTTPGCQSQQGIEGKIVFESGNQMPGPGVQREPAKGVKRELLIYPLLKATELEAEGNGFYSEPAQPPVKTVTSNDDGSFRVQLPPGNYSLLVREKEKLYANLSDGAGHIHPVEVKPNEMLQIEFKITYAAHY
ncbi:hypothetical protein EDD80_106116 [Anseongella ginsenosidimutans]|uniref:Carboxypeptidase family protein n=1 Tax=Anseongella ginsenosidimutans TaxID=496056 RepID=A0A4R3KRA5_9SPHI|nr:carboxypeptidase-like regulatory domain-containing protein [Anseongella ginsenosidimutans]QEC52253.1 carboxypeptidase regulatory-like domain-containing protein [Anseongella ginsenosidimutans]TCS86805.1 hypothetical protein EDD80_106116 [Anseongella ginsenosidimutans]